MKYKFSRWRRMMVHGRGVEQVKLAEGICITKASTLEDAWKKAWGMCDCDDFVMLKLETSI